MSSGGKYSDIRVEKVHPPSVPERQKIVGDLLIATVLWTMFFHILNSGNIIQSFKV